MIPSRSVHASKSMPTELSAPDWVAGPSIPMVRNESYSASGMAAYSAGLTGPTLLPKGLGACHAGGKINGEPLPRRSP